MCDILILLALEQQQMASTKHKNYGIEKLIFQVCTRFKVALVACPVHLIPPLDGLGEGNRGRALTPETTRKKGLCAGRSARLSAVTISSFSVHRIWSIISARGALVSQCNSLEVRSHHASL